MRLEISTHKLAGGILLGAVASGLAMTALSGAGSAGATCASISGIGNGNGCASTPTSVAIGIGPNTFAEANGLFDVAIANGATNTGTQFTSAVSIGTANLAYAGGPNVAAFAGTSPGILPGPGGGSFNVAIAQGSNVLAAAGSGNLNGTDVGNVAINIADDPTGMFGQNNVRAGGFSLVSPQPGVGNIAVNIGGTAGPLANGNTVTAFGQGNLATNLGGTGNFIAAGNPFAFGLPPGTPTTPATFSTAFGIGGSNNTVVAAPGPFNVAGEINHTGTPGTLTALNTIKIG